MQLAIVSSFYKNDVKTVYLNVPIDFELYTVPGIVSFNQKKLIFYKRTGSNTNSKIGLVVNKPLGL